MNRGLWSHRRRVILAAVGVVTAIGLITYATVDSTVNDFFQAGTQPGMLNVEIFTQESCIICHGYVDPENVEVAPNWMGSMMAQAARDPVFYAGLAIANQDVAFSGDLCIRCHTPRAWVDGRADPPDGSALLDEDRDGVNCHTCHRMVDPIFKPGISPEEDVEILAAIDPLPIRPGSGNYIIDPEDRRRGPFIIDDPEPPHGVPTLFSPFHKTSELCATCHDVSNPLFERQPDGTYVLGSLDMEHSTGDQYDMMPIERTYSEWLNSDYPFGVDAGGRFGGTIEDGIVSTCQTCHMPRREGRGCIFEDYELRPDMPKHDFAGANTWVLGTLVDLWPEDTLLSDDLLTAGQDRIFEMLELAATLEAEQDGGTLMVTIINETGHKLPTGYPEGRRMWLNVEYYDEFGELIAERGAYDLDEALLTTGDTKVYEMLVGVDAAVSAATGVPEGPSFHLVLNNVILQDNRIPPRGFTNAAYEEAGAPIVGADYPDGQYWDNTGYILAQGAASATVNLYYQTSSREYIEFLRDENVTNDWGDILSQEWETHGKSEPFLMATATVSLDPFASGDHDLDGDIDAQDFAHFQRCYSGAGGGPVEPACEVVDFDFDDDVDLDDFATFQELLTGPS